LVSEGLAHRHPPDLPHAVGCVRQIVDSQRDLHPRTPDHLFWTGRYGSLPLLADLPVLLATNVEGRSARPTTSLGRGNAALPPARRSTKAHIATHRDEPIEILGADLPFRSAWPLLHARLRVGHIGLLHRHPTASRKPVGSCLGTGRVDLDGLRHRASTHLPWKKPS